MGPVEMVAHMTLKSLSETIIGIKGAGEMASAVAWRLYMANIRRIFMMEVPCPRAVRRKVSFSEAVHDDIQTVEGVTALLTAGLEEIEAAWRNGQIAVIVDPEWTHIETVQPDVVIDAILAKQNLGTSRTEAPRVIGLGPGFTAGQDVHMVIETDRGRSLGRIVISGAGEPNTGIPGNIEGYTGERVLRATAGGIFSARSTIGARVKKGEVIGDVDGTEVCASINGVLRGLIRSDIKVHSGLKLGDIDPRGEAAFCYTISDKARNIAGSVLEVVLRVLP